MTRLGSLVCLLCLAAPWLNPHASGPSSSVIPWLFSAVCIAVAYGLGPSAWPSAASVAAMAGLGAWTILSTGLSPESVSLAAACLLIILAAAVASGAAKHKAFVQVIAQAWLIAAVGSTAIALVQYFGAAERLAPLVSASATGEAFSNLRQRNQFASLTAIGMASLFWVSRPGVARGPAMAAMAWLAIGNAATTSRTGLLELMLLGVLALIWPSPRRHRIMLWLAGLAAYVVAAVMLPWLLEIATGEPGPRLWERVAAVDACSSRTVLWSNVVHLIAQKPWIGWGWGNLDYAHYATLYEGPRFCDILDNAHSLPLHLAVELGVPAAMVGCLAMLWAVIRARPWATHDAARQMAWAVMTVISFHSLLEYPLWYGPFQISFGLCLGLLWPSARCTATGHVSQATQLALAAGVAVACGLAAWDYRRVSQIYLPAEARSAAMREDPLPEIRRSWLFRNQARFAELTITPLTHENAAWTFDSARALLHYSPEPRVIEKLIDSAVVLGREQEILLDLARFRAAFPEAYAQWKARAGRSTAPEGQPAT